MSLQLRRGTNAERLAMTPAVGEIIYTTDTKKVWAGDGATVGGIEVGSAAPVDSVAGKTGVVTLAKADITDFVETDYATGAEGDLATSATQPADAISTLTNDSGYITGYTVTQGDVTAHQAALSLTESQISDLGAYITGITGESIKNLSDVFTSMVPTDGQVLTYDTTNGWQSETLAAIPSAFTDLTDTPANYTGESLKVVRVNAGETALEYVASATPTLPTTTKGDLIVHNGTTDIREAIGTNDQVLTADSTQASGMKWATAAGGGGADGYAYGGTVTTTPVATGEDDIVIGDGSSSVSGDIVIGPNSKVINTSGGDGGSILIGKNISATRNNGVAGPRSVLIKGGLGSYTTTAAYGSVSIIGNQFGTGNIYQPRANCVHIMGAEGLTSGSVTGGGILISNIVNHVGFTWSNNSAIHIGGTIGGVTYKGVSLGDQAYASGTGGLALGDFANSTSTGSLAVGQLAKALSNYAVAIGRNSSAPTSGLQIKVNNGGATLEMSSTGTVSLTGADAQYVLPSYTVATVPAAPVAGSMIYVTDGNAGAASAAIHDGTNWKVIALGATISAT